MRLRQLRKLEELEIRKEFDALSTEKASIEGLLASEAKQWQAVAWQVKEVRKTYGKETQLGRRRTQFSTAPETDIASIQEAMIEKEPITVIISEKGWIRALRGHIADFSSLAFKDGDGLKTAFPAQTTDKLLLLTTGGKAFTLGGDKLPGGRGHGEPVRLMVDMENDQDIVTAFVHDPARKQLIVSSNGNGFIVAETDMVANTRKGKQIMNVKMPDETRMVVPVAGDHVAIIGENRKLLVFPLVQVAEMARGKGVRLQRYKDGGVSDVKCFAMEEGLNWSDSAGRAFTRTREELIEWFGDRAQAGRIAPKGFPRSGKFSG
jgi:topoisomerase-4 subunit A